MGRASVERAQDVYQMTQRSPNRDVSAICGFLRLEALTDTKLGKGRSYPSYQILGFGMPQRQVTTL